MARCKLTNETRDKILTAIRTGNYLDVAAAYAGISRATLHSWLKQGRSQDVGPFRDFVDAVDEALAVAEVNDLKVVEAATADYWQAAAWRLERRHPERWGRQDRSAIQHQVQAELDTALDVLANRLPAEEYKRVLEALSDGVTGSGAAGEAKPTH